MLSKIESGTDGVSFVLVFKLSRFGRNAADVLNSLQIMQYMERRKCVENAMQNKLSSESVYRILACFDKLYDKFTDKEKKKFMNAFIERVDIYPKQQENGSILKHIKFKFPVYFDEKCVVILVGIIAVTMSA
ncbi:MAG: hypothetical protein ACI4JN_11755 [Ruminococcus sp.]